MFTEYRWGEPRVEPPNQEITSMSELAHGIWEKRPHFVLVGDVRATSDTQRLAASLVESLALDPLFEPETLGLYVEALFHSATPETGDFSGNIIKLDKDPLNHTNYRGMIKEAIKRNIPVHGIDSDSPAAGEVVEDLKRGILEGPELMKVVVVDFGHMRNKRTDPHDLISRLGHNQCVILNERISIPPDHSQVIKADIFPSTRQKYNVATYNLPQDSRFAKPVRSTSTRF